MKTATAPLIAFLNGNRQCLQFDLWTFALASGTILRWTDADVDLAPGDGRLFVRGPVLERARVTWARGVEVDQLTVKLAGPSVMVDGQPLPAFAAAGGFDSGWASLERVYANDAGVVQGSLVWFSGGVADVTPGRMGCDLVVKSQLTQLQQQLPRNLYQAGCLNTLFDSNCGVARVPVTWASAITGVGAGYNPLLAATMGSPLAQDYFTLGIFKFTSGQNAGLARTVQAQIGTGTALSFQFSRPFPFPVHVGDAFTVTAGCDKTQATCNAKFANLARFRGQPYIPVPETVT